MNRREWLTVSMGLATWPEIVEAQEHSHAVAKGAKPASFTYFDAKTAADVESLAEEILPATDTPGAKEAGAVYFIDRALATFDRNNQKLYKDGLADLNARREKMFPGTASIAGLTSAQRIELLKAIDRMPFFQMLRTHTIYGCLSLPEYGGNHNGASEKILGYKEQHVYTPPFGYYDAEAAKGGK